MNRKVRIFLCLVVAVLAAGAVTVTAYVRSLPEQSVQTTSPSDETVIGEHESEPEELPDDTVVYRTPQGEKYHLTESCRYLAKSKTILSLTKKEATEQGLTFCSACEKQREKQ